MNLRTIEVTPDIYQALIAKLTAEGLTVNEWLRQQLEIDKKTAYKLKAGKRPIGLAAGIFRIPDNFDDPLEDFEEYM